MSHREATRCTPAPQMLGCPIHHSSIAMDGNLSPPPSQLLPSPLLLLFFLKSERQTRHLDRRQRFCCRSGETPHCAFAVACSCLRCCPCLWRRSEEHTSELQSHLNLVCR